MRGSTLVEAMVALAVILVLLASTLQAGLVLARAKISSACRNKATVEVLSYLERLSRGECRGSSADSDGDGYADAVDPDSNGDGKWVGEEDESGGPPCVEDVHLLPGVVLHCYAGQTMTARLAGCWWWSGGERVVVEVRR